MGNYDKKWFINNNRNFKKLEELIGKLDNNSNQLEDKTIETKDIEIKIAILLGIIEKEFQKYKNTKTYEKLEDLSKNLIHTKENNVNLLQVKKDLESVQEKIEIVSKQLKKEKKIHINYTNELEKKISGIVTVEKVKDLLKKLAYHHGKIDTYHRDTFRKIQNEILIIIENLRQAGLESGCLNYAYYANYNRPDRDKISRAPDFISSLRTIKDERKMRIKNRYFIHTTVNTGHSRKSFQDEVDSDIVAKMREWFAKLEKNEKINIFDKYYCSLINSNQGFAEFQVTIKINNIEHDVLRFVVCLHGRYKKISWELVNGAGEPPESPFIAVLLINPEFSSIELADFERCMAWGFFTSKHSK